MSDFADAFQSLREQFLRGAGGRILRIAQNLERLSIEPSNLEAVRELQTAFHGFSGLGGTYGFPRVSTIGHECEARCAEILSSSAHPLSADLEQWRILLEELKHDLGLSTDGEALRVMVVAGGPEQGAGVLDVLEMAGYVVHLVPNLEEAEIACRMFRPDLLLFDEISAAAARETDPSRWMGDRRDPIPVLVLSKSRGIPVDGDLASADAAQVLVKPIEPGALLAAVAERIEARGLETPGQSSHTRKPEP